ncbi:TetR/AcrR family transcriptional regulator [Streptomyces justiciae]|uniref:Helix-turn-helix domain-containing protein n=1 Tax=Streptomyces justiciae TaxID=2780140 RepID=A0ABU3LK44_9ACTN|nr:helix-turn-helix domain-containing protein [Streptomyces justiciae]MDT7839624.1 helix-turn-helix domain-containing protein [Streptomyces justiciae]
MEAVLTAAVALLDEAGQSALTFRALAARLGTGVGTIYWYVSSKDELFDRATDHAVGAILTAVEEQPQSDDPIADLREMAITLFDAMMDRPWLAAYFMRNTDVQGHSLRLYEKLGQQTLRLDLTPRQRFHAVSAIVGVVVGTAADLGAELPQEVLNGEVNRVEYLSRYAESWRRLDAAEFPFVHEIADEFAEHDDRDQFLAALELTLAGLRLQAETP